MNDINLIVTNADGNEIWLDLYEEQPIKLTFNIEDIITTTPKAEYSRRFRLPATDKNFEFFETVFEVNGTDFNPGNKYAARININGSDFRIGEIRLQNVFKNDVTGKLDYECVFIGSAKSLASEIGEKHIGQLDWSDYTQVHDLNIVTGSWEAYPENGSLTAGIFDGNVIFPIVDFGNTYTGTATNETRIAVGHPSSDGGSFDQSNHPLIYNRCWPMIRVREVMRRIFEQHGFTFDGQFLTENFEVAKMYLSAWGDDESIYVNDSNSNLALWTTNGFNLPNATEINNTTGIPLNLQNQFSDPGGNLDVNIYTGGGGTSPNYNNLPYVTYEVPGAGNYTIQYNIPLNFTHVEGELQQFIFYFATPGSGNDVTYRFTVNSGTGPCAGQDSEFTAERDTGGGYVTLDSRCGNQADGFSDGEGFTFDEYFYDFTMGDEISTTITAGDLPAELGPHLYYIIFDTINLNSYVHVDQGSLYQITAAAGEYALYDSFNTKYKCIDFMKDVFTMFRLVMVPDSTNPTNFTLVPWNQYIGRGRVKDWSGKLVKDKDIVIRPLLLDQTDRLRLQMDIDEDILNQENQTVAGETFGTKILDSVYDILQGERVIQTKIAATPSTQIEGWDADWEDFSVEFNEIPVVSYSDQMVQDGPNNKSMLFEKELSFDQSGTVLNQFGQDLYTRFWSDYVELLYNKDSRRVTAYFTLNSNDVLDFKYNDVIFVEGVYYYVEKIYDAPLGQTAQVKIDLITLKNYRPSVSVPIPPDEDVWEDVNTNWENITDNWEDV